MHQQAEAKCIGNQCGLAEILHRNPEHFQGVRGAGIYADYRAGKGRVQQIAQWKKEDEEQAPVVFLPLEVFDEFIKECGTQNGWSDATYEKFAAVRKHLEKFDKGLTFESLDEPKLTKYVNFLKDTEDMRNTSIMKQVAYLKWFLRWCTKKGYCMNNAYEDFNPKLRSTPKR